MGLDLPVIITEMRMHGKATSLPDGSSKLEAARTRTNCVAGLIVHSDQGWHYKTQPFRAMRHAKHEPQGQLLRQRSD